MGAARLVLLVGRPGSGKSHLGRLLAARVGAELVQTDAVRRELFPAPTYAPAEREAVYAECRRRAERALADGRVAILDATHLREAQRQPAYAIATRLGAEVVVLLVAASELSVRARLEQRRRGADPAHASQATWDTYLLLGPPEPIPRPHLVLNSDCDAEDLVNLVARRIQ